MWGFILRRVNMFPDSYLFDDKIKLKYLDAIDLVVKHGKMLKSNLSSNSKCAILCESGLNCAISILACWYADLIPIPLSINYGENHCKKIIELTQPDFLITDTNVNLLEYQYDLLNESFSGFKRMPLHDEMLKNIALIMCTSGTTGTPKGALITNDALKKNITMIGKYFKICSNDKIVIARPLYHCAVLTGEFLVSLCKGLNIAFFDKKYTPNSILTFIKKYDVTVLCGTPTLLNHLSLFTQRSKEHNKIKNIAISGECLNKTIAGNIRKSFKDASIYNVYGLTEASPRVSYLPPENFDKFPQSVGIPLEGIEIEVRDENNTKLPVNEKGFIWVKTPCVMQEYYMNTSATKKAIVDGWLSTGDIGYKDSNSYLYILSRADDMIIKGGMNIYPKEIENQLINIPQIKECVAYGIKTEASQNIAIDVVLKSEYKSLNKKDLLALISEMLPLYQMPSEVNIVTSLKRNASGKLIRKRS